MRTSKQIRRADSQRGVALLIAIFVLLIIGAVGVALILSSSTETSIAANYRTATQAFYDAKAGLEEGRGRLWTGSGANSIAATIAAGFTTVGTNPPALPVGRVYYITNPAAGEVVAPNVPGNAYYDSQYKNEWNNVPITAATVTTIAPATAAGLVGPLYKWVRITATTEKSTNHDVNKDGALDNVNPLFYDGTQQFLANQIPPTIAIVPKQVFTVTALAVTPSGSTRILEYTTAMTIFNFKFPSALTLDGKNPNYQKPTSVPFVVQGNYPPAGVPASCPAPPASLPAVGVVGGNAITSVVSDIQQNPNRSAEYTGGGLSTPSVADVTTSLPTTESDPSQLEALVAQIESTANYVIQGPVTSLTPAQLGTAANPVTVVIDSPNNGATANLTLSGNVTGYGILVVRGTYSPAGTVGWNGIVLVIGQGDVQGSGGGNNSYNGAVFVANTRDSSGKILNNLGTPIFDWSGGGGNGIAYNPCTINNATRNQSYQVLSFREIPD